MSFSLSMRVPYQGPPKFRPDFSVLAPETGTGFYESFFREGPNY